MCVSDSAIHDEYDFPDDTLDKESVADETDHKQRLMSEDSGIAMETAHIPEAPGGPLSRFRNYFSNVMSCRPR